MERLFADSIERAKRMLNTFSSQRPPILCSRSHLRAVLTSDFLLLVPLLNSDEESSLTFHDLAEIDGRKEFET